MRAVTPDGVPVLEIESAPLEGLDATLLQFSVSRAGRLAGWYATPP